MKEQCRPKGAAALSFPSPELPPPATNPGKLGTVLKLSSRATTPPKGSIPLELGKEKFEVEILGLLGCFRSIDLVRLEIGLSDSYESCLGC